MQSTGLGNEVSAGSQRFQPRNVLWAKARRACSGCAGVNSGRWMNDMTMGILELASKSGGFPLVGGFCLTTLIWDRRGDCSISSAKILWFFLGWHRVSFLLSV